MTDDQHAAADVDEDNVKSRAKLTSDERAAGSFDPETQARVVLEESLERTVDRDAAPGSHVEHRRSEETVEPE